MTTRDTSTSPRTGCHLRVVVAWLASLTSAVVVAGCGIGSAHPTTHQRSPFAFRPTAGSPTVLVDPTMRRLFGLVYGEDYPTGSAQTLRRDLARGVAIDVFSSTSRAQLRALQRQRLIDTPIRFATDTVELIVSRSAAARIRSPSDLAEPGVRLTTCAPTRPCSEPSRSILARLGLAKAVEKNTTDAAQTASQLVAAVRAGRADAAFVYGSDIAAANTQLNAVPLPARADPTVGAYVALVRSTHKREDDLGFIKTVLGARVSILQSGFNALPAK